jgi:nitrite reductase/ring-hydroxylating ferredoxin subunit
MLIVLHIALGALQASSNPLFAMVVATGVTLVCTLHLAAGALQSRRDAAAARAPAEWIDAGAVTDVADGAGIIVRPAGAEAVAIFRTGEKFSALSNRCAHQNGPLGEGRVIDGCATCPWHGYQYGLEDGCAPAPYTDKLPTYRLRIADGRILLDPRPNAAGTRVEPARVP